jgi:hypothetical protein
MKKYAVLFICLTLVSLVGRSLNAPVTTVGSQVNVVPGSVTVPITVTDFINIGSMSLTLDYNYLAIQYVGETHDAAFGTDPIVFLSYPGRITIAWSGYPTSITLPDLTEIVNLTFTFIVGKSNLTWYDIGGSCEYMDGNNNVLNDSPTSQYYINGVISGHVAPVTTVSSVTNAVAGTVNVPVMVDGFWGIQGITLTLEYDPAVLTYLSFTRNPAFDTSFQVSTAAGSSGKRVVIIVWMGAGTVTLPDASQLLELHFTYSNLNANYSLLTWVADGTSCEYADQNFNPIWDNPASDYYKNGMVAGQLAPDTYIKEKINATPGNVMIPVWAHSFNNIGSFSITFEYDPSVISYDSIYTLNPILAAGDFSLHSSSGSPGMKKMNIGWNDVPRSLAAGNDTIVKISFTYLSGSTPLAWKTDGPYCEYADSHYNVLWDSPKTSYYHNGIVANQIAPRTKADSTSAILNQQVIVPVRVYRFTSIGSVSLTLDYDPGVLTYQGYTANPLLAGPDFTASLVNLGRVSIGWSGLPSKTLPDGDILINLKFLYKGGSTNLDWYDNGGTCEYMNGSAQVLNDEPQATYYINGFVGLAPVLNSKVFLEGPYTGGGMSNYYCDGVNPCVLPLNQPYSGGPWYYTGTEHVSSIPANITDWILVEIRTTPYTVSKVRSFACFLRTDGKIVDLDGVSNLPLSGIVPGNYYLLIRHRNHLAIMSGTPVTLSSGMPLYDFTSSYGQMYHFNDIPGCKQLSTGVWGMFAGDANASGLIDNVDLNAWRNNMGFSGYNTADFNLSSFIDNVDLTVWRTNYGNTTGLPSNP